MNQDLVDRVREEVLSKLLENSDSKPSDNLNEVMFSFIQVKETLYSVLMDIEISEIKKKWGIE